MAAVSLALLSSLSYGVSDYLAGLKSRNVPLLTVLLVSQAAALAAIVATLSLATGEIPSARYLAYGVATGLAEVVGLAALYNGLAVGKMSIVAAVAATAPLVPVVASVFTGDSPGAIQWFGIVVAIAGVGLLAVSSSDEDDPHALARPGVSIVFGLLTAGGLGLGLLFMSHAAEGSVQWALITARGTSVAVFALTFLVIRPDDSLKTQDWGWLTLIGVLALAAEGLFAVASLKGILSVVAVLSSLYPVVTILLARFHLGEQLSPRQIGGIAIVLAGAAALSVG